MWTNWQRGMMVAALALGAAGCYESDYPLDPEPLIDFTPAVLGVWRCLPLEGEAGAAAVTLTITRGGGRDRLYAAAWQTDGATPDRYEAYASVLQGTTLMNVRARDKHGPSGTWTFLRHTLLRPNVLHLQVVAEAGMTGVARTATAVRAAVERERNSAAFYTDVAVCARTKTGR